MKYRNIRVGQKLFLRGQLTYLIQAEVVQVDPRRITHAGYRQPVVGDPVQVKAVLYPGEEPSLLWVNPERLMETDR